MKSNKSKIIYSITRLLQVKTEGSWKEGSCVSKATEDFILIWGNTV